MKRNDNNRVKVAFFDFASCEGCQLQVLNLENELLDILNHIEIVNFREAMSEKSDDYVIAFVEGSITKPSDIHRIKEIRENAKILVALGACAADGCVNSAKNLFELDDVKRIVYGEEAHYFETFEQALPVEAVVDVDYFVRGCPINKDEFLMVVESLLSGRKPHVATYPVCLECQIRGNVCLYDVGEVCLGPIIRGGCNAWCPSNGFVCEGCRGFTDDPNLDRMEEILHEHGLGWSDVKKKLRLFNSWTLTEKKLVLKGSGGGHIGES